MPENDRLTLLRVEPTNARFEKNSPFNLRLRPIASNHRLKNAYFNGLLGPVSFIMRS